MAVRWLCNLFGKPFDGGKRNMDHGHSHGPHQHQPPPHHEQQSPPPQPGPFAYFPGGGAFPGYSGGVSFFPGFPGFPGGGGVSPGQQHPALVRLGELQGEVATLGPHVCVFSGLQSDREYKRLERELTHLQLEVDQVETEGRGELQQARKRVAGEVEGLLRYLEGNAGHPSRLAVEALLEEARALLLTGIVEPHRAGLPPPGGTDELLEAVQDVAMRLAQVKTGGSVPLRKARYRALTRVCAVLEVLEGTSRVHTLPLPLSNETHAAVQGINRAMGELASARGQLVALLMGLSGRDSCANLARALTELQLELDALDVSGDAAVRNYRKQVVEEINALLKHLDLEEEGDNTHRYDLTQNDSIREIEGLRGRVSELRREVLRHGVGGQGAELQSLLARLDEVNTGRNPCIREARRRAVLEVQAVVTYMDLQGALWRHHAEREQQPCALQRPPLEHVWRVLGSLGQLQGQVLGFEGKRADKSYVVLEEMLTKQLLDLDAVDSQGDADAKAARKQAVKYAQNILSYLDMKTDEWEY